MSSISLIEKLQLQDEKNLLLQGLPLAIEKQFIKYSFSKNVTPLLRTKKVDFALVFAFSQKQLKEILKEVLPALHGESKFWIAYPKSTSKIASDLCRDASWDCMNAFGYETLEMIAVDNLWNAVRFTKPALAPLNATVQMPGQLAAKKTTRKKAALLSDAD
ncbi:MAG: hypothetical protein U0V75_05130 [Ferruginibacter sp.]